MRRLLFVAAVASLAMAMTASAEVTVKYWTNTATGNLAEAVAVVTGGTEPSAVETLNAIDFPENGRWGDNYVSSIEGYIIAPATGEYTFYIAADDHAGLFLSPDSDAANLGVDPVCQVDGWSNRYEWKSGIEKSEPIALQAGYHYAFRAVQREGGGGDHQAVAWTGPGINTITVIGGDNVTTIGGDIWAITPTPGADHVTDITLSWFFPDAPAGTVYMVSFGADTDTWLTLPNPGTSLPLGTVGGGLADYDTTYYWQVVAGDKSSELLSFHTEHNRPQFDRLAGTAQPQSTAVMVGGAAELSCIAASYTPSDITYQWYKDGVAIEDATDSTIGTAEATLDEEGVYTCVATNDYGSTESEPALVDVQQGLIHRYTFNDGDVAEIDGQLMALDVVGGADGIIKNATGLATVADGVLTLGNSGQSSHDASDNIPNGDYVDLPNGLISSLSALTVEAWATYDDDQLRVWPRIFSFGTSDGGEESSQGAGGANASLIMVCPNNGGGNLQVEWRNPASAIVPSGRYPLHKETLMTFVQDDLAGLAKVYINGIAQGVAVPGKTLSSIEDNNNWLGRSQWPDPLLIGSFNEFRIHDTALTAEEVLANYMAGPDALGEVNAGGPCDENVVGDVNGDCVTDFADAAVLIEQYLLDAYFAD